MAYRIFGGIGERDAIGTTAAGEDLWRGNELSATPSSPASEVLVPQPPDVGEQMTLVSESTADNGATATGALTVAVHYIDAAGDEQVEVVTMNGTTEVDTVATDIRFVQELQVKTVGSNSVAEGNIRIFSEGDDTLVYNMIAAGGNQSLVPHRMVPIGKRLRVTGWTCSEKSATKRCVVRLRSDCNNEMTPVRQAGVFLFKGAAALDGTSVTSVVPFNVPELSVVKASAWVAAAGGAEIVMQWWGELYDTARI